MIGDVEATTMATQGQEVPRSQEMDGGPLGTGKSCNEDSSKDIIDSYQAVQDL